MASPVVAGIAALYFQKYPNATWQDVKTAIIGCADKDGDTGDNLPDNNWGYGKVNGFSAVRGCNVGIDETNNFSYVDFGFFPNPVIDKIGIQYDLSSTNYKSATIEITNVIGEKVKNIILKNVSNSIVLQNTMESGIYFGSLLIDGKTARTIKVVVL